MQYNIADTTIFDEEGYRWDDLVTEGTIFRVPVEHIQEPNPPPPPPPAPFHPNQATSDWLSAVYSEHGATLVEQESAMRQDMLIDAYILMHYTNAWDGDIPTPDKFMQAFAGVPSEEVATFSAEVSAYAQHQFDSASDINSLYDPAMVNLEYQLANDYGMTTKQRGWGAEMIDNLAVQSIAYLSVTGLDEIRQEDHTWNQEQFRKDINELIGLVKQMPTEPMLGVPTKPVRDAFEQLVKEFEKEFDDLLRNRSMIHEYETERADRIADEERRDNLSLPRWIELPTGFVDVADIPMSLRDLIIFGDSSAILGLLPLVPNSVTSRLGRMARATRTRYDSSYICIWAWC